MLSAVSKLDAVAAALASGRASAARAKPKLDRSTSFLPKHLRVLPAAPWRAGIDAPGRTRTRTEAARAKEDAAMGYDAIARIRRSPFSSDATSQLEEAWSDLIVDWDRHAQLPYRD
jgi:hypothetical protein